MAPSRLLVLFATGLLAASSAEAVAEGPVIVKPAMKCPQGYLLEGNGCIMRSVVPATATCRHKGELEGHECVETGKVEASLVCNEGLLRKGKKCIRHDVKDMMLTCEEGFRLENGTCVGDHLEPTLIECPKGFKQHGLDCIRSEKHKAEHGCPDGFRLRHERCISQRTYPATEVCSDERFRLVDGKCVSVELTSPEAHCPKGFKLFTDPNGGPDRCTSYEVVEAHQLCDRGTFDGKKYCVVEDVAAAVPICPKDYSIGSDGDCFLEEVEDPVVECSHAGWIAQDGRCVHQTMSKPVNVCPPGTTQARGKCERYDVVTVNRECPDGSVMRNGLCISEIAQSPNISCPKFYRTDENNMCSRRMTHKVTYSCPPGTEQKGRLCHATEVVPPSCPGGNCQSVDVAPARMRCPRDFTMDTTGKCIREVIEDMAVACPPGSTLTKKNVCERKVPVPALLQCPPSFHPVSSMEGVVAPPNKQCVRLEAEPAIRKGY